MKTIAFLTIMIWLAGFGQTAQANLIVCNETGHTIAVAIGWSEDSDWRSRGWFSLKSRECKTPIVGGLKNRYYWYYADDPTKQLTWSGTNVPNSAPFCVSENRFYFRNANRSDCEHQIFRRLDTGENLVYRFDFTETRRDPREAAISCENQRASGIEAFSKCWMRQQASVKQRAILDCLEQSRSHASFALCSSKNSLSKDAYELASCTSRYLNESRNADFVRCLAQDRLSPQQAQLYDCAVRNRGSYSDMVSCAGSSYLTDEQRKIVSCVQRSGASYLDMGICAAGNQLSPDERKVMECVASNRRNYTQMAVCAVGNQLTPEQQVFVSCAISSGGQPYVMAGCVGTQLTVNELEKCVTVGIGGRGCFGDNNTAVQIIRNQWNDVTRGPGPTNDLVGRDGFTGRQLRDAARDLRQGPGPNHDLFGENGFVRRNAPPPVEVGRIGGTRICIPWC